MDREPYRGRAPSIICALDLCTPGESDKPAGVYLEPAAIAARISLTASISPIMIDLAIML
jgi:hypothetical protein